LIDAEVEETQTDEDLLLLLLLVVLPPSFCSRTALPTPTLDLLTEDLPLTLLPVDTRSRSKGLCRAARYVYELKPIAGELAKRSELGSSLSFFVSSFSAHSEPWNESPSPRSILDF